MTVSFARWLYDYVGEPWHWIDRNVFDDDRWETTISAPGYRHITCVVGGVPVGYCEYELQGSSVEITYFGLGTDVHGHGLGGWFLTEALHHGFSFEGVERVWLHTCSSTALMLERITRPVACGCSTPRSSGRCSADRPRSDAGFGQRRRKTRAEPQDEGRPVSDVGGKIDPTAVRLDDLANDRESETGTALLAGSRGRRARNVGTPGRGSPAHTRTVIRNGNKVPGVEPVGRHRDVVPSAQVAPHWRSGWRRHAEPPEHRRTPGGPRRGVAW